MKASNERRKGGRGGGREKEKQVQVGKENGREGEKGSKGEKGRKGFKKGRGRERDPLGGSFLSKDSSFLIRFIPMLLGIPLKNEVRTRHEYALIRCISYIRTDQSIIVLNGCTM